MKIFEEVGVEKIAVGSKEDKMAQNIIVEEKIEKPIEIKKEKPIVNKRRYKPIEKIDKYKIKKGNDDSKIPMSYEGFYVQDAQRKIENWINEQVLQQGLNEITLKVIRNIVENAKKAKKGKKEKESKNNEIKTTNTTTYHNLTSKSSHFGVKWFFLRFLFVFLNNLKCNFFKYLFYKY